ncbi:MAG: 50S ribosomal protein L30 [Aigarchaeota archaeon]|nr:50S ribosomal protein L30 [Aigarchaeota archaeon]MDW8093209.1 50S ribosomal protein L30 [Nitrososphaerota archaeon]
MSADRSKILLVIRLRGSSGASRDDSVTLRMLNLLRANHATLLPNTEDFIGMLRRVQEYVTWGEPDSEALALAIRRCGEVRDGLSLEEGLRTLGAGDVDELASRICNGELGLEAFKSVFKPYIRLHPPRGGLKSSIKRPYSQGGALGYRGSDINRLLRSMI